MDDKYYNGYNNNMLVGIDQFGRSFTAASGRKPNREVGVFFFLWIGHPAATGIYDVARIREEYGDDVLFHKDDREVSPEGQQHFWTEPLFGYYNSADPWVIRRQIELLTNAGIDFLIFDTTNAVTYSYVYKEILKNLDEIRAEGWETPRIAFYTHSLSIQTINSLYYDLYKPGLYESAWYKIDGKPLIIGYTDVEKDIAAAHEVGRYDYKPEPLADEILNFFTFREARWPGEPVTEKSFPWTEWQYPQPLNTDVVSVSLATHPAPPFSFSVSREAFRHGNRGRGFDVETQKNKHEDILRGTFFDSQWKVAHEIDPPKVFIAGWNEWITYKSLYDGEYMYCDNVDLEFSRDIEMMRGGYNDAYYIQLIQNVRKYKYEPEKGIDVPDKKTININGGTEQWDDVGAVYRSVGNTAIPRDYIGASEKIRYVRKAARNNLQTVRTAFDDENLFFCIETEKDICVPDDSDTGFMNIMIGCGNPSQKGFEGYEYIIGRKRCGDMHKAQIEKLSCDYSGTDTGVEAEYSISGKVMQVKIPRSVFGDQKDKHIYFKIADDIENPYDIMDYYVSGKSFPLGRLSYICYLN